MTDLRPYQRDVVDQVAAAIDQGKRRIIVVAPTGAGKTIIGTAIIKDAITTDRKVLVLAHIRTPSSSG
jgi:DNA repair protein RadD